MTNLLEETIGKLAEFGMSLENITYIGTGSAMIEIEEFKLAADFEYYGGYGLPEIREDLYILLDDGSWMTRAEYDGAEWWERHSSPVPGDEQKHLTRLVIPE